MFACKDIFAKPSMVHPRIARAGVKPQDLQRKALCIHYTIYAEINQYRKYEYCPHNFKVVSKKLSWKEKNQCGTANGNTKTKRIWRNAMRKRCRANFHTTLSERSSARGVAESFIRTSKLRSSASTVYAAIAVIKRNCRRSGVKLAKTAFVRFAARYLRPKDRTAFIAPTLADRKPTAKALRLGKWSFWPLGYP